MEWVPGYDKNLKPYSLFPSNGKVSAIPSAKASCCTTILYRYIPSWEPLGNALKTVL